MASPSVPKKGITMANAQSNVRVDLRLIDVDDKGRVIINNEQLAKAIQQAKDAGAKYAYLEAEVGDFCVSKSKPCA
jgi:hypothetical protein